MTQPTHVQRHLDPDDPRHGTNAGYVAGCRCADCGTARFRARKRWDLYGHRVPAEHVERLITQWTDQGIARDAVATAARVGTNTLMVQDKASYRVSTVQALLALNENDFAATAFVYADLTRRRVFSLMAAGHRMTDMPIRRTGTWRHNRYVTIGLARAVRDHFRRLEATPGTSAYTASRARNAGYLPPLAWDDPDTLGWPEGSTWSAMPEARLDTLAEYEFLIRSGESHEQAIKRLGVTESAIEMARYRAGKVA